MNNHKTNKLLSYLINYLILIMASDWDSGPSFYKKGSIHNKIGMILLWLFICLALFQIFMLIFV